MLRLCTTVVLLLAPLAAAVLADGPRRQASGPTGMRPPARRAIVLRPEDTPPALSPALPNLMRRDDAVQRATFESVVADENPFVNDTLADKRERKVEPSVALAAPVETEASLSGVAEAVEPKRDASPKPDNATDPARKLRAPSAVSATRKPSSPQPFADFSWLPKNTGSMSTTTAAAALGIGLLLLTVALLKRAMPRSARPLPEEVVSLLGRVPLANKQTAQLMKVGGKLVLVAMTPDGAKTLTEVTDPEEVARLLGLIEQANPQSASAAFRDVFDQIANEPTKNGFLEEEPPAFAPSPMIDRSQLAAAYANTPGGRAHAA